MGLSPFGLSASGVVCRRNSTDVLGADLKRSESRAGAAPLSAPFTFFVSPWQTRPSPPPASAHSRASNEPLLVVAVGLAFTSMVSPPASGSLLDAPDQARAWHRRGCRRRRVFPTRGRRFTDGSARRDRRRRDCRTCLQRGMAGPALSRCLFDKVQPWILEFMAITDIACTLRSTIMLPAVAKNFLK
jgi:hypothetical protein